jgi:1,2-diacylglycerol 3-alpha-glucosyltransferase
MWCGRLSPEKRPEVFLDAVGQVPGIRAEMFGDGVTRNRVAAAAARLADRRLTVHGGVPQSHVLQAMRHAHVLVSSSLDFDNQPMVILEGIATGLPVIVTDPDLAEMLPHGAGLVTRTPDADGLARTLRELLDDPDRITAMSTAAIAHRSQVAQTAHRDALLDVYRSVLAPRRRPSGVDGLA